MSNNSNISSAWAGFRKLWIIVAILLFLLLVILALMGYGPWGTKCDKEPTIVEKIVEKETIVDNPDLVSRIGLLEKENAQIATLKSENAKIAGFEMKLGGYETQIEGYKTKLADLTKSTGLIAGLQAKVKALEAVDLNFDNPKLMSKISLLETENASIADLKKRILELQETNAKSNDDRNLALTKRVTELETENGLIAGLKAKVAALEAVDVNFIKPQDNTSLLQKISGLEAKNLAIPVLESRIKVFESEQPSLVNRIGELEKENGLIAGLKAKVAALEAIDINFIKPQDNSELIQKINNLEVSTLKIPTLQSRIESLQAENGMIPGLKAKVSALEAIDINFIKPQDNTELLQKINNLEVSTMKIPTLQSRIESLQAENSMIPGLKAKVSALEAIDINFIKPKDDSVLIKRIDDLEAENGIIPGLKAKIKALEAIDINFISNDNESAKVASKPKMASLPKKANLYFESGSSRFPTDSNQSMADVIVYLRANPNSKVSLAGFHDATGNINWNRRLASKRSNRVKQILLNAGISNSRITVQKPSQTLGTGTPEEARRVEVKVSIL